MSLADELRSCIKGEIDDSSSERAAFSRDASLFVVSPEVVVAPWNAEDIASLVRFVAAKKEADPHSNISLTARSAGTDMSGGPLNTSIIINMTCHFNRILEVGNGFAVTQPGVFYRNFDTATKEKGWILPSYTASREINTVGGMVANNSGGEKNLKYGKTARYIEELEMVLSDGRVHVLRKLEGEALRAKLAETGFEGDLYRKMSALLIKNRDIIEKGRPTVTKNSSGYALWDGGDGETLVDLPRIIAGSQGTLGIVTKIRFSLVRPTKYSSMVVIMLKDLQDLGGIIPEVLKRNPDSFESYDDNTFKLGVKYFPEFAAQMKMGLISLGLSFLPELWMLITGGVPKLILMAEFCAEKQLDARTQAEDLAALLRAKFPQVGVRVAATERKARKYWVIRRESFNLLRKKIRGMRTAPFIDDFVVPPASLPEFLPKLQAILGEYDLTQTIAGHVGDGNFHIIPLIDPKRSDMPQIIDELSHKIYDLVISFHGSITGEHNDGLIRTPYVEKMFGSDMYGLFEETKKIFDPENIFNPGKKVGGSFQYSMGHLDLPGSSK